MGGCPQPLQGSIALEFFPELAAEATEEVHPFFRIAATSGGTFAIERISIRYYFTNESASVETASCYWVTGDQCQLVRAGFFSLAQPTATASRYLELRFAPGSTLLVGSDPIEIRVGFSANHQSQHQSNDYSFDPQASTPSAATPRPYRRWERATVYVDDVLVWGSEPCSTSPAIGSLGRDPARAP
jgi:cellulose 1,4-beta-cellobiosidase